MLRRYGLALLLLLSGCAALEQSESGSFLSMDVKDAIHAANPLLKKPESYISVAHKRGIVLLYGDTGSDELRQQAEQAARAVPGVEMLHNEITVNNRAIGIASANDALITSRLKGQLMYEELISPNQIKVVTDRGIVYLLGQVSRQQAEVASNAARGIGGVQKVVKVFLYTN